MSIMPHDRRVVRVHPEQQAWVLLDLVEGNLVELLELRTVVPFPFPLHQAVGLLETREGRAITGLFALGMAGHSRPHGNECFGVGLHVPRQELRHFL